MITLDNGDKIRGDATNATEVDFTIYGLDNNTLKQLADGQLPNSIGDLYTADSTDVATAIVLVNTGAAHNHVNLYLTPSGGTARRLIPKDLQLEAGYSVYFEGGKCSVLTTGGAIVYTFDTTVFLDDTDGGTNGLTTRAPTSNVMYDHGVATTGVHGVGAGTIAKTSDIPALDNATLTTLLGLTLAENDAIILDAALSVDGKYNGIVRAGVAGATLAFGDLCYLAVADSKWELADADAEATTCGLLGICVLAAANDGDATKMLLLGIVRADTAFPPLTVGAPAFVSTTAGDIQTTAPSGVNDCIRIVGQGWTGDELWFCPSLDWFEHV